MDDSSTFLEFPLDRELYRPRSFSESKKPIHVLITEAGCKIAYNLMYAICSGEVFGPDQGVVLHLVNARGAIDHRANILELDECAFHLHVDSVIHSETKIAYHKVDVVVMIAMFEDISGHSLADSLLCQIIKAGQVARNMKLYAKSNAKLVLCGPSTKGLNILLTFLKYFEPDLCNSHISSVVMIDETISKSLLASQLKTTTDKIKNIVIWGATYPDVHNATIFTYPPEDKGMFKKVDIPLEEIIEDQEWLHKDFITAIYRRTMINDLIRFGKAVATATSKHLKALFQGTDIMEEIVSMGTIVPDNKPYGIDQDIGFAFPVLAKNGVLSIREDIRFRASTHLMNIRLVHNLLRDPPIIIMREIVTLIKKEEEFAKTDFIWSEHVNLTRKYLNALQYIAWAFNLIVSRNPIEKKVFEDDQIKHYRTITWNDYFNLEKKGKLKSFIRTHFSILNNQLNDTD